MYKIITELNDPELFIFLYSCFEVVAIVKRAMQIQLKRIEFIRTQAEGHANVAHLYCAELYNILWRGSIEFK